MRTCTVAVTDIAPVHIDHLLHSLYLHHPPQDVFPEPEEMEMEVGQITSALSQQLVIEDIDESDHDNPQLCSEYVKEIYEYMRQLEVRDCVSRFPESIIGSQGMAIISCVCELVPLSKARAHQARKVSNGACKQTQNPSLKLVTTFYKFVTMARVLSHT